MAYKVLRTDRANDQLHEVIQYIMMDSGSVDIALSYLEKVEHMVRLLAEQPHLGSYPRYSILKKQGYRVLIVERHLIFYKVNEAAEQVVLHAFVDARREYRNLV